MLHIKIKNARESQGMSQRDLANKTGLSAGYIGIVETGKVNPSIKTLNKIAKALNVDSAYLLEKEPTVLVDNYREHLSLHEKEFIAQQENKPWIVLAKEFSGSGLSPDKVKALVKLAMQLSGENK